MEGYGQNLLDTPDKKLRRVLYNLYLYLIMIIECYYRKYETKDQENWRVDNSRRNGETDGLHLNCSQFDLFTRR